MSGDLDVSLVCVSMDGYIWISYRYVNYRSRSFSPEFYYSLSESGLFVATNSKIWRSIVLRNSVVLLDACFLSDVFADLLFRYHGAGVYSCQCGNSLYHYAAPNGNSVTILFIQTNRKTVFA